MNLDRFAYGLDDPQEAPVLAYCAGCGGEIYEGEMVCQMDQGEVLHWEGACLLGYFRPLAVWAEEAIEMKRKKRATEKTREIIPEVAGIRLKILRSEGL